jgi:glucokinase
MILAGDVGGTKVNLACFQPGPGRLVQCAAETFPSREHPNLEAVVRLFLAKHKQKAAHACFGIAGPIKQGRSLLTNLRWTIDAQAVAREFRLKQVWLLNDLQATAYGIAALPPDDFVTLNQGEPVADGNQAVIAAGTGLGETGIVWNGRQPIAVASEGGNTDFAPRTDLDVELFRHLRAQFGQVIWERVLSGPGLFNIYQFLRDTKRGEEPAWLAAELKTDERSAPPVITRAALEKKSDLCAQALDLFVTYYGAEAANLALKFLATGGVCLGGGIAPKIIWKLKEETFLNAFCAGRYCDLLSAMPVKVIMNDKTALLGAAQFAAMQTGMIS